MTHPADIEDRLKAALRAEAAGVAPDAGSLSAIRARGRAVRRRRRAAIAGGGVVALAAVAFAVPALVGTDGPDEVTTMTSPSTDPTGTAPTTEDLNVLSGDTSAAGVETALWPDPAGELYTDPVEAARSFVEAIVGEPVQTLSPFRPAPEDPAAGEVDVQRYEEDGTGVWRIGSTLQLRRLDHEHWFVTAATSDDVRIDAPAPMAEVTAPLTVTGEGRGWEGRITVDLLTRSGTPEPLASTVAFGGELEAAVEPFSAELDVDAPAGTVAIVVVRDEPGEGMLIPSFSAVPIRIGAADAGP